MTPSTAEVVPLLDTSSYTLHSQGAEARVWEGSFLGRPAVVKQRFRKGYRHPSLDAQLTSQRLRQEVRSMLRARKIGIPTPIIYSVDMQTSSIYMEKIAGHSLKIVLKENADTHRFLDMMRSLGVLVAKLHDGKVVHGDLTTGNILVLPRQGSLVSPSLVMIDFGLSYFSSASEDRAVDLYVLERAFASAHAEQGGELFAAFIESYRKNSKNWCSTLNRFAEVRMRGRKRSMVG